VCCSLLVLVYWILDLMCVGWEFCVIVFLVRGLIGGVLDVGGCCSSGECVWFVF